VRRIIFKKEVAAIAERIINAMLATWRTKSEADNEIFGILAALVTPQLGRNYFRYKALFLAGNSQHLVCTERREQKAIQFIRLAYFMDSS
jgi:hypothetical protein